MKDIHAKIILCAIGAILGWLIADLFPVVRTTPPAPTTQPVNIEKQKEIDLTWIYFMG